MCALLDCSPNRLPEMIEQYWGRILAPHGFEVDRQDTYYGYTGGTLLPGKLPQVANYLTRAERQQYRLFFQNGKVFQIPWWRSHGPYAPVLAESRLVGWTHAAGNTIMYPGYAGFALSMGRDFYMARHHGGYDRDNFFHSSYLAGDTVLCTGTMLIEKGRVRAICNDSGHYRPTVDHLINVLQALEMYGILPSTIDAWAVAGSWKDRNGLPGAFDRKWRGNELLRTGGRGWDLHGRHEANVKNMRARGWKG
jgi:hypothetical protein